MDTQTVPPADLHITAVYSGGVGLSWTPISYTMDGGGYEISYATDPAGPYSVLGETTDKTVDSFQAEGLPASGGGYYFRLRSHTPPHFVVSDYRDTHDDNPNDLYSLYSTPISVTDRKIPGTGTYI